MANATRKVKIGVIGCGHWGRNYVRNFFSLKDTALSWVCDLEARNLNFVRDNFPTVAVTQSVEDLLNDKDTDAITVALPASGHFFVAKQCLEAGKDLLIEKPMTIDTRQAYDLVATASKHGRVLMVGHTFLFNMAVRKVKQLIDAGEIGEVYYMKAVRSHLGLIREDVNVVWDLATHDISIFNYLTGAVPKLAQVAGERFFKRDREDVAFITLRYPNQVLANIHVSWADSNKQRTVEIVGSKGRILFDDLNTLEPVRLFQRGIELDHNVANFGEYKYLLRDGDIISPNVKMVEPLRAQCEHFVECVRTRANPLSDGAYGAEIVRILCDVEAALEAERR